MVRKNANPGNILFENFYQGTKVYDSVHEIEIYPSRYQQGKSEYLQWSYSPISRENKDILDKETYLS